MSKRIGFIGLGIMGKPMSMNLLKAGYELVIYDVNSAAVNEVSKAGAKTGSSPKDVASQCDVIITMLPDSPQVEEVVLNGANSLIEGAKPGSILIDMSSIAPAVSQKVAARLKEKGIRMLDAPVSGGEPGAIKGTLSIMVGGEQSDFDCCLDILKAMGSSAVLVGKVGAGNTTKLANQIIVAVNIAAVSEAFTLAVKAGVDPERVYQAIRGGLAGSSVLDAKAPMMMSGNFNPGFRINLHIKDLKNALATGHETGSPLPLTSMVMEFMQSLKADGLENLDHSALARFYEKISKMAICQGDK
jgi:2-hydroxy-3-oxopropionate reductase